VDINLPVITGVISTTLFAISTLPMVLKVYRTKDLKSYSLSYLLLGNAGNIFHSVYVFNMPPGPIWLLHTFYLVVTGLMLFWYLRYEWWPRTKRQKNTKTEQNSQTDMRRPMPVHEPV